MPQWAVRCDRHPEHGGSGVELGVARGDSVRAGCGWDASGRVDAGGRSGPDGPRVGVAGDGVDGVDGDAVGPVCPGVPDTGLAGVASGSGVVSGR